MYTLIVIFYIYTKTLITNVINLDLKMQNEAQKNSTLFANKLPSRASLLNESKEHDVLKFDLPLFSPNRAFTVSISIPISTSLEDHEILPWLDRFLQMHTIAFLPRGRTSSFPKKWRSLRSAFIEHSRVKWFVTRFPELESFPHRRFLARSPPVSGARRAEDESRNQKLPVSWMISQIIHRVFASSATMHLHYGRRS